MLSLCFTSCCFSLLLVFMVVALIVGMSIFFKVKSTNVEESVSTNKELQCFAKYLKSKKKLDVSFSIDSYTGSDADCEKWILKETNLFLTKLRHKIKRKTIFYPKFPHNPIDKHVVDCLVDQFRQGNYVDLALINKVYMNSKKLTSETINGKIEANENIIDNKLNNEFYLQCAIE